MNNIHEAGTYLKNGADRTPNSIYVFGEQFRQLDEIRRRGWELRGIEEPETVGVHTLELVALVSVEAERLGLDVKKVIRMAMIHDLGEVKTGDITPHDKGEARADLQKWIPPSPEELRIKNLKEQTAIHELTRSLPLQQRQEIRETFDEFIEGKTAEAKLVRSMDVRQRLIQAKRYYDSMKSSGKQFQIESFIAEGLASDDPEIKRLARRIQKSLKPDQS